MPRYFHFHSDDGEHQFNARIICQQCAFVKPNGERCRKTTCIGLPCCNVHLSKMYKVKIMDSTIPNSGKGLFAFDEAEKYRPGGKIVFREGARICPYAAEIISTQERERRYGPHTAPYGLHLNQRESFDAALKRGAAAYANHSVGYTTNSKLVVNPRKKEAWLVATKNIRQEQEIFCNYGPEYSLNEPTTHTINNKKYNL